MSAIMSSLLVINTSCDESNRDDSSNFFVYLLVFWSLVGCDWNCGHREARAYSGLQLLHLRHSRNSLTHNG